MNKKLYTHRYWRYEGNHPNGQDCARNGDELDALKEALGISLGTIHDEDEWSKLIPLFAAEVGEQVIVNGKVVKIESIKIGKFDGFGREIAETFRLKK